MAAALTVDEDSVEDGIGLLLEAVRGAVVADDWRTLVNSIPQAPEILAFHRRRTRSACIIGPPPQSPDGLAVALRDLGFSGCRADLLASFTIRFLGKRLGQDWCQRALFRLPALAGRHMDR